jgi:Domain of unknown function (DUF4258)
MRAVRWSAHALASLRDREIDREEAERTLTTPQWVAPAQPSRRAFMRAYVDPALGRQMLLRVIVEDTEDEIVIVTVYKTSQIDKYLRGARP